jgi:hypothetical protein
MSGLQYAEVSMCVCAESPHTSTELRAQLSPTTKVLVIRCGKQRLNSWYDSLNRPPLTSAVQLINLNGCASHLPLDWVYFGALEPIHHHYA